MLPHFLTTLPLPLYQGCRINKCVVVTMMAFSFLYLFTNTVYCQPNITRVEYYIDIDPGFGNAAAINITQGTDITNLNIAINPETITEGVHRLYVRAKNANGNWSLTNTLLFYKPYSGGTIPPAPAPASNISRVEYYLDNDPGFGVATPLTFTAGTDIQNSVIAV